MKKKTSPPTQEPNLLVVRLKQLSAGILAGCCLGVAFQKSGVFHPDTIKSQLFFGSFAMMKLFLTSLATSLLTITAMEHLKLITRVSETTSIGKKGIMNGHEGNVLGGLMLGAGMSLAGACPGTLLEQLAANVPSARYTLLGFGFGALSFGYLHKFVNGFIEFVKTKPSLTLDQYLNKSPLLLSLGLSTLLYSIVIALEFNFPWEHDIVKVVSNFNPNSDHFSFMARAWSPIFAGAVIGLSQIPTYLLSGTSIGASSAFITVASHISALVDPKQKSRAPYFNAFQKANDFFQVGVQSGIFLISLISISLSGVTYRTTIPIHPSVAFLGGTLVIYGARIGAGCTSGHGFSGIAQLSIGSMVSTASMFAGAFATTFLVSLLS